VVQRKCFLEKDSGLGVRKNQPSLFLISGCFLLSRGVIPFTNPLAISLKDKADNSGAALGTGSASKQLPQLLQELQGFSSLAHSSITFPRTQELKTNLSQQSP